MDNREVLLEVKNVSKIYGDLHALKEVSFQVRKGEWVAIMGSSGSGKSTLMNTIGMLDTPTSGEYYLEGQEVARLDEKQLAKVRNQEIGFVFQQFFLLSKLNAFQNVELPLIYAGVHPAKRKELAEQYLEKVELHSRMHHLPSQLSGGERQRAAVARSLIADPELILADEPTGNLDPENSLLVADVLFSMAEKYHKTLVMVTHDTALGSRADKCFRIKQGRLIDDL